MRIYNKLLSIMTVMTVVFIISAGCEDNRISMDEFLKQQQQAKQAAAQPTKAQLAISKAINKAFMPYKIGPEDVLSVTIYAAGDTNPVVPIKVRVNKKGELNLPMVGRVKVAGLDIVDAEQKIYKAYVPNYYKEAVVHLEFVKAKTVKVLVTGAVNMPGLVKLQRNQSNLLFAIVSAGGISPLGMGQITLRRVRSPGKGITLDLTNPVDMQQALSLAPLRDGDIVMVHSAAPNTIYVGGLVNKARPEVFPPGVKVTVLQAIAAAGGLRTDITPKEATLIRRMPNGKDAHVKLDLDAIMKGKKPNITLASGDILWVPYTAETRFQEWLNQNFFFRAGVSVTYNLTGTEDYLHSYQGTTESGRTLQDIFDPFGSLLRNQAIQRIAPVP